MKKALATLIIIMLSIGLFSCGSNNGRNNEIKIETFEQELADEGWTFTISEKDGGYSFEHSEESWVSKRLYSGLADKNKNVKSITITNENVDTDYLSSYTKLIKVISKTSDEMTANDIRIAFCLMEFWHLEKAISPASTPNTLTEAYIKEAHSFLKGGTVYLEGWTIKSTVDYSNGTIVITASN